MRGTFATTVLVLALASGVAQAQPAPNPAADAALAEGRRLYDLQEWDKAIAKFKEAYALREDAAALFNIAQSYRLKGDCAQSGSFYKTFKRKFPNEKNIDKVEKFIVEMDACAKLAKPTGTGTTGTGTTGTGTTGTSTGTTTTGTGTTGTTGTGTTVTGTATTGTGKGTTGTTGTGTITTTKTSGGEITSTPIDSNAGGTTKGPRSTGPTGPVDTGGGGGGGQRLASYALMGAGGAGLIVGAIFGVKARGAASEAENLDEGDQWKPSIQDRGLRNQRTATVSLIAGGALAAGGVILFLLSRETSSERGGVSITPTADGAQLVWGGSF
ncbi:MAG: tetratricopeptide repeat protein [Kofleriaceae bacterium]